MLGKYLHGGWHAFTVVVFLLVIGCAGPTNTFAPGSDSADLQVEWAGKPTLSQTLAAIRAATTKFHDEAEALAAGYRPSRVGCESSSDGAMGIHYGHPALLGVIPGSNPVTGTDPRIELLRPEVLLYEPQADGSRRLVGIEYVVYRAAWDALSPEEPPTLLDVPFDEKFGSEAHGHADHYELHVWLWRHNPLGMFAPWNPMVSCP